MLNYAKLCDHQTDNYTFFRWEGLSSFLSMNRTPLLCGAEGQLTKGFTRSYKNLNFFWILGAGHFVSQNHTILQCFSFIYFKLF